MSGRYVEGALYVSAGIILLTTFWVPHVPGTVEFFVIQAFVWGLASYLVCYARKLRWLQAGLPDGPPWIKKWEETAPAWAFEASFLVQMSNIVFALGMAPAVLANGDMLRKSFTLQLDDLEPSDMWLDHVIFASLAGFMVRDCVLFYANPDLVLALHHLGVLILMVSFGFAAIPGVRLLAFITPVVEIGTSFYCAFSVWRWASVYWWVMNLSNAVMFLGTSGIFFLCPAWTPVVVICYIIGIGLAVGRTTVMVDLLRKHGFWGAPAGQVLKVSGATAAKPSQAEGKSSPKPAANKAGFQKVSEKPQNGSARKRGATPGSRVKPESTTTAMIQSAHTSSL